MKSLAFGFFVIEQNPTPCGIHVLHHLFFTTYPLADAREAPRTGTNFMPFSVKILAELYIGAPHLGNPGSATDIFLIKLRIDSLNELISFESGYNMLS